MFQAGSGQGIPRKSCLLEQLPKIVGADEQKSGNIIQTELRVGHIFPQNPIHLSEITCFSVISPLSADEKIMKSRKTSLSPQEAPGGQHYPS